MFDTRRMAIVVVALAALTAQPVAADDPVGPAEPETVVRSIAEIHALSTERLAAGVEARFRGVVTTGGDRGDMTLTVQQNGVAAWVEVPPDLAQPGLVAGAEIEVEGTVRRRAFAPSVRPRRIVVVGQGPLPEPVPADFDRLSHGLDNARRVAVTGIVQYAAVDSSEARLIIKCGAWAVPVRLLAHDGLDVPGLLDARVRAVGVIGAVRNSRGEMLGVHLTVNAPDDVTVVEPPQSAPFAAPEVPLEAIAWFNARPLDGRRFLSRGTVTALGADGAIYLQRGRTGVRVEPVGPVDAAPGDVVEVAGFLDTRQGVAGIFGALVRKMASGPRPEPLAITPDEILNLYMTQDLSTAIGPDDYAGCLVRFPATLVDRIATLEGGTLVVAAGRSTVTALVQREAYDAIRGVEAGSRVEITGIVNIGFADDAYEYGFGQLHDWRSARIDRFTLLVSRADDLVVTQPPPWWTPRRLAIALCAAGAGIGGALAWVALLRRQVMVTSTKLLAEMRDRQAAAIEFDATLRERSRLAANLHDTLLQSLAGAMLQLDVCRRSLAGSRVTQAGDQLDVAKRMVKHAAADLRSSVWALRTAPAVGRSFTQSLRELVDHLNVERSDQEQPERVRLQFTGAAFPLPRFVAGNLLLVVQEAVRNAMHHAEAAAIDVTVRFDAAGREVEVSVRDDGCGFEWGRQRGTAQGHFGLQGMKERVESLRGRLTIDTAPGRGTTVTARVTAPPHDAIAEDREAGDDRADADGAVRVARDDFAGGIEARDLDRVFPRGDSTRHGVRRESGEK